jgi:hypothetical protein
MNSSRNDTYEPGSLRIRVTGIGRNQRFDLVRYTGQSWEVAENNSDLALQADMRAVVAGRQPGLYVPPPQIGINASVPLKAA